MKNRDYKNLVTIATAVALIVESLGAVSSPTLAKDAKTTAQTTTAEKKTHKRKTRSLLIQNHINLRQYMQRQTKTETSHLSLCLTS